MKLSRAMWGLGLLALVLAVLPLGIGKYYQAILIFIGINAMVALGLNLLMGYAGQISLGHAAFHALGAYGSAILTVTYHLNPWLAMVVSLALACTIAS